MVTVLCILNLLTTAKWNDQASRRPRASRMAAMRTLFVCSALLAVCNCQTYIHHLTPDYQQLTLTIHDHPYIEVAHDNVHYVATPYMNGYIPTLNKTAGSALCEANSMNLVFNHYPLTQAAWRLTKRTMEFRSSTNLMLADGYIDRGGYTHKVMDFTASVYCSGHIKDLMMCGMGSVNSSCKNGGVCEHTSDVFPYYECRCPYPFIGRYCERAPLVSAPNCFGLSLFGLVSTLTPAAAIWDGTCSSSWGAMLPFRTGIQCYDMFFKHISHVNLKNKVLFAHMVVSHLVADQYEAHIEGLPQSVYAAGRTQGNICVRDHCRSIPCFNGATCQLAPGTRGFSCVCNPGTTGKLCEINQDPVTQCEGGSRYINNRCDCPRTRTGKFCQIEIDGCAGNPCGWQGRCISTGLQYRCECAFGYSGTNCQKGPPARRCDKGDCLDECISRPCQNGGICINRPSSFQCICLNGYTGKQCSKAPVNCNGILVLDNSTSYISQEMLGEVCPRYGLRRLSLWLRAACFRLNTVYMVAGRRSYFVACGAEKPIEFMNRYVIGSFGGGRQNYTFAQKHCSKMGGIILQSSIASFVGKERLNRYLSYYSEDIYNKEFYVLHNSLRPAIRNLMNNNERQGQNAIVLCQVDRFPRVQCGPAARIEVAQLTGTGYNIPYMTYDLAERQCEKQNARLPFPGTFRCVQAALKTMKSAYISETVRRQMGDRAWVKGNKVVTSTDDSIPTKLHDNTGGLALVFCEIYITKWTV